jgi:hypothetical protein
MQACRRDTVLATELEDGVVSRGQLGGWTPGQRTGRAAFFSCRVSCVFYLLIDGFTANGPM